MSVRLSNAVMALNRAANLAQAAGDLVEVLAPATEKPKARRKAKRKASRKNAAPKA